MEISWILYCKNHQQSAADMQHTWYIHISKAYGITEEEEKRHISFSWQKKKVRRYTWHDFQLRSKGRTTIALSLSFQGYQNDFYEVGGFQLWGYCWLLSNEGQSLCWGDITHVICPALMAVALGGSTWNPSQRCFELSCFSEEMEESSRMCFCMYLLHLHSLVISDGGSARICWTWQCQVNS